MVSKKLYLSSLMLMIVVFSVLAFVNEAAAQGRYATVYSKNQVSDIIRRAEDSSDRFRTDFRNQMNQNYGLSNSQKNQYNGYVAQCEESLDRLRDHFNKDNTWWNSRNQVQDVVRSSLNVNTMMNVVPFRRNLETQWRQLRNDINTLADTYDLPGLNGGGWNGGGGGGYPGGGGGNGEWPGGNTSQPPSWAVGTFYSTNSNDSIQLTISNNGRIGVVNNGQNYWGRFYNNQIYLNNDASTITKWGNGIRTYNRNTGVTTNYTRNGGVVGPGPVPGYPGGNASAPPSWAQGTFYSTNNGQIYLTINGNGRVTVVNGGQTYYGTYYNGILTLNGDSSTVTRSGNNGIQTYNQNTGQTTNYRRR